MKKITRTILFPSLPIFFTFPLFEPLSVPLNLSPPMEISPLINHFLPSHVYFDFPLLDDSHLTPFLPHKTFLTVESMRRSRARSDRGELDERVVEHDSGMVNGGRVGQSNSLDQWYFPLA